MYAFQATKDDGWKEQTDIAALTAKVKTIKKWGNGKENREETRKTETSSTIGS